MKRCKNQKSHRLEYAGQGPDHICNLAAGLERSDLHFQRGLCIWVEQGPEVGKLWGSCWSGVRRSSVEEGGGGVDSRGYLEVQSTGPGIRGEVSFLTRLSGSVAY